MPLTANQYQQLKAFFNDTNFAKQGGVITDLDGTAIHEYEGVLAIPQSVELGLKKIYDLGRPVIINTLRFPLSVMLTFGKAWYRISNAPVPTILMNGSLLGYMIKNENDEFQYEELAAFPLSVKEIDDVLAILDTLLTDGVGDVLLFYYPRDWKQGEIIWTPLAEKLDQVKDKYRSASSVISFTISQLGDVLKQQDICMIFLLIDIPQDKLMAYQHTKKSNFFTNNGVDKLYGAEQMAKKLNVELIHCLGAGDSEMDTFLKGVGLAVHVGNPNLQLEGVQPPIRLGNSSELGELLYELANLQRNTINTNG